MLRKIILPFLTLFVFANLPQMVVGKERSIKLITDSINYAENSNILRSSYQVTMVNDFNPVMGQKSNDEGYTSGIFHDIRVFNKKKLRFYDISLKSDLYTEYQFSQGYMLDNRWTIPQKFTEINTLKFSVNQYLTNKNLFASIEVGTGVRNKKQPIWGLSLFLQGGSDGLGGIHSHLGEHGAENLVTGEIKPFLYIAPSITKHFISRFSKVNRDRFFLELKAGFALGTSQIKSTAFINAYSELPVFQINGLTSRVFKLSTVCRGLLLAHTSGLLFNPELGAEVSLFFLTLGYTSIFYVGDQQADVIDYYDNESSMRAYLKINF